MKHWIEAMRLRTLPLALACIGMGAVLALSDGSFNSLIFLLCCLTTISLQILSNLANDYGDSIHGADNANRLGPLRAVQSGVITSSKMRKAVIITSVLSLIFGIMLLVVSDISMKMFIGFIILGLIAIAAAILYTNGKLPYGYHGLGDLSVFLFFGLLAVLGTYFLQTKSLDLTLLLPASSCGLFAVAVLNINNIRDIKSDKIAGKHSLPVMLGLKKAKIYHLLLLFTGLATSIIYVMLDYNSINELLFLLVMPLLILNGLRVYKSESEKSLDPLLKQMALTTLLFVILFGISIN
ncbi:MAG: 1,4-dihydroxy-2-naphthoate polyprenyltransferase [Saprospiraceae bacterium]|nr:1,4-dihydroxy-2-naphthoate polyprenyltransferase [Bacteroidia bacterium]NNL93510.1 1,4-dihydroxy-2-naphthoate polyprenyltransferase [Saprospiraceae bacterium]